MALNMKTLTQALAKTAAVIEKTVQTTVQEVTGPRALQEYDLLDQIGSAGPGLAWKLYAARAARGATLSQQYPVVCVWVLDKRALSESRQRAGLSKAAEDSFLDLIRADAARLVRLRHPGVVHVVQALDENKNAMAMVTEPLFASVANALGNVENVGKVPKELMGMKMGLLEVKHGLLQIAESLDFLHNNARLIHCAISPENVFITSSGAWKLGGFGFAISSDQSTGIMANGPNFHYAEYDVEDSLLPLQPSLNYTAPELARSKSSSAVCSSDIFSFGCLAYHLIAHKQLFDCHNNVKMYMNHLTYLSNEAFSSIPPELVPDLQKMLSANESSRPTALEFTGSPFFRDDTRLRALRFLDHMLARDNMQKSEFLKALSDMWKDFDARVLRYKVLPPLCAELRNLVMQPMILPMVLTIAESQEKNDFDLSTLPALVPVLSTASGDTLLLLVKYAELLISKTSQEQLVSHVLPMLVRAYGDNDARIQEVVLRKSASLANRLDAQLVKQAILPRVHGLALRTTVAAVRVNALLCLSELVQKLDKQAVLDILQTIQRCTSVDRSPPTLMCTLGVANSVLKQHGVEFAVEHVLPILAPLLTAQQLNVQQFAKYMLFVKDILRSIELKRGVAVMDSGIPEIKKSPSADGLQSQALKKASGLVSSATRSSSSWDEDWGSTAKGQSPAGFSQPSIHTISSSHSFPDTLPLHPTSLQSNSPPISAVSTQQTTSCPPIDVEWPPPDTSSGVHPQFGDSEKPMPHAGAPTSSFDDIDPFANWPPKRGDIANDSGSFGNGTFGLTTNSSGFNPHGLNASSINGSGFGTKNDTAWAFNSENITQQSRQNQGGSTVGTNSGFKMQNSIGSLKQDQGSLGSQADKKMTDIESIFGSNRNDQSAPRLAPPPSTAVGRGRGRGGGNPGITAASVPRPNQVRSTSKQPPLLDLL